MASSNSPTLARIRKEFIRGGVTPEHASIDLSNHPLHDLLEQDRFVPSCMVSCVRSEAPKKLCVPLGKYAHFLEDFEHNERVLNQHSANQSCPVSHIDQL